MNWRTAAKQTLVEKNTGGGSLSKPTKLHTHGGSVSFGSTPLAPFSQDAPYTPADIAEMDRLIRELAMLEDWTAKELEEKQDERQRMAPTNVYSALQALRAAHAPMMAAWPEKPVERSRIGLCWLTEGRQG